MEIQGKVLTILPLQTGEGKNGVWKKQEFILETEGQYPKKVCFSLWGDKIEQARLAEGISATVFFDLESREYNGRWFTEAKAWKVGRTSEEPPLPPPPTFETGGYDREEPPLEAVDDLPF